MKAILNEAFYQDRDQHFYIDNGPDPAAVPDGQRQDLFSDGHVRDPFHRTGHDDLDLFVDRPSA